MDHRLWLQAPALGFGTAHQQQRGGAIGNRAGVGRSHRAALAERWSQAGNLFRHRLGRLLVIADLPLLFALSDVQRDDLIGKVPFGDCRLGPSQRFQRERVLLLTGEAEGVGALLGKGAHQAALVVGVFQTIEKHVVEHPAVPHAIAATGTIEQIRRVAHAFHAASDDDFRAAGEQLVVSHDHRLHARAAHLVHCGAGGGAGQPGAQSRLARWGLALAGGQHTAHQHVLHVLRRQAAALHRRADGGSAELRCRHAQQITLETTHGRTRAADDYDRIIFHLCFLYLAAMRKAPSRRITSPLSMLFSKMCRTSAAYSAG